MADHLKTPFVQSQQAASQQRAVHLANLLGKGLPCTVTAVMLGPVVTVAFDQTHSIFNIPPITMPVNTPEYIRLPIQVGDKGRAHPGSTQVQTLSGLGKGTPSLGLEGNLSTLVFHPVSSKNWSAVDPNALTMYGKNGVVLMDTGKKAVFTMTPTGLTITIGTGTLTIDAAGNLKISGNITAGQGTGDAVTLQNHTHAQGADSHGDLEVETNKPTGGS